MASLEAIADIKVIDVDTHVVEPADLWTSRVSTKKWGDKVPHVVWSEKRQEDIWLSEDKVLGAAGAPASAGYEFAPPKYPPRISDAHPSTWRAEDRLAAMDEYGIHAQVLYPNVAGFGGGRFSDPKDAELNLLLIQAYNDYLTDFASVVTGPLHPGDGNPVLGRRSLHQGDGARPGQRPPWRDHVAGTRALRPAQNQRCPLGPDVGGGRGDGPADQLPHRWRRQLRLAPARSERRQGRELRGGTRDVQRRPGPHHRQL